MGEEQDHMAQQGASLQNYNNELVKCLEDLREKREQINREIAREEDDKNKIQNDLKILTERLSRINDSLARKVAARNEYDQSIQETEAAYLKVGGCGPAGADVACRFWRAPKHFCMYSSARAPTCR